MEKCASDTLNTCEYSPFNTNLYENKSTKLTMAVRFPEVFYTMSLTFPLSRHQKCRWKISKITHTHEREVASLLLLCVRLLFISFAMHYSPLQPLVNTVCIWHTATGQLFQKIHTNGKRPQKKWHAKNFSTYPVGISNIKTHWKLVWWMLLLLLPQNKCKKERKKKEKNPASPTSTLYSSGILPVINAIFPMKMYGGFYRILTYSFAGKAFFRPCSFCLLIFSVFSLLGKKAPQPHHEIFFVQ